METIFKIFVGILILPGIVFIRLMWIIKTPIPKGRRIYEDLDKIRILDDKGKKEAVFERMIDKNENVIISYSILMWILIISLLS